MLIIIHKTHSSVTNIIDNHFLCCDSNSYFSTFGLKKLDGNYCDKTDTLIVESFDDVPHNIRRSIGIIHDYNKTFSNVNFSYYNNINNVNIYHFINLDELNYLKTLDTILTDGEIVSNRTGTDCISLFDMNMSFNIDEITINEKYQIPVLTTKTIYTKGVIIELLWFLRGLTDTKWLSDRKVSFWDGNTSKEALEKLGLPYEEGQLGPGYGHQWVNWGGDFMTGKGGINQVERVINTLKTNPSDRRMIISAWNVSDLPKMALPPCHLMYMFKVTNHKNERKTLNCKIILRSNDMFLGSPFNIMSGAILTCIIAKTVNMIPGKISLAITDAHIYSNHINQVKEQMSRKPMNFPYLSINSNLETYEDIKNLEYSDFKLSQYDHHPTIKAEMAV